MTKNLTLLELKKKAKMWRESKAEETLLESKKELSEYIKNEVNTVEKDISKSLWKLADRTKKTRTTLAMYLIIVIFSLLIILGWTIYLDRLAMMPEITIKKSEIIEDQGGEQYISLKNLAQKIKLQIKE